MSSLTLIIHDVRSSHNVGAMLRTAEGLGISEVIFTGYTPFPKLTDDPRLPHLAAKIDGQIKKTSLGAEKTLSWQHQDINEAISDLRDKGYVIAALEQTKDSIKLPDYQPAENLAIIVGNEITGVEPDIIKLCDLSLEIPMAGKKESFNVASAAAIALYHCKFFS